MYLAVFGTVGFIADFSSGKIEGIYAVLKLGELILRSILFYMISKKYLV